MWARCLVLLLGQADSVHLDVPREIWVLAQHPLTRCAAGRPLPPLPNLAQGLRGRFLRHLCNILPHLGASRPGETPGHARRADPRCHSRRQGCERQGWLTLTTRQRSSQVQTTARSETVDGDQRVLREREGKGARPFPPSPWGGRRVAPRTMRVSSPSPDTLPPAAYAASTSVTPVATHAKEGTKTWSMAPGARADSRPTITVARLLCGRDKRVEGKSLECDAHAMNEKS